METDDPLESGVETVHWLIKEGLIIATVWLFWVVLFATLDLILRITTVFIGRINLGLDEQIEIISESSVLWQGRMIIILGSVLIYVLVRTGSLLLES